MVNICNARTHRTVVNVEYSVCFLVHSTIYYIYMIGILTGWFLVYLFRHSASQDVPVYTEDHYFVF